MNKFQSFTILNGQIICGSYPYDLNPHIGEKIITSLLERGINVFIDLTENDEKSSEGMKLLKYETSLNERAQYINISINEESHKNNLKKVESIITELLQEGKKIFLHCRGGHYRTSLVCTYYLMQHHKLEFSAAFHIVSNARKDDNYTKPIKYPDISNTIKQYLTKPKLH
jgi:protein-tyrosine phosphatase